MDVLSPQPSSPLSVCLVSHFAYGALTGGTTGHSGGVERQTNLVARWLRNRGHRVSVITWDEGQPDEVDIDGIRVFKVCRQDAGLPGLRFLHPRWTSLTSALRRANADVYYHNCGECVTGQVALWCCWQGRKFIFSSASDADCDADLPFIGNFRDRTLYQWGLKLADQVIVQTHSQQTLLAKNFGKEALVLPMPCPEPVVAVTNGTKALRMTSKRVLWVGQLWEAKRPDRFLDVAAACPQLQFDLVGPQAESDYSRQVVDRASQLSNVTVHGRIAQSQMPKFYQQAACLCCTSDKEGFPNVFLEAWSHGLPVVSTFDPDDTIGRNKLGVIVTERTDLSTELVNFLASEVQRQTASTNARRYYLENHQLDRVMLRFERIFCEVVNESRHNPVQKLRPVGKLPPSSQVIGEDRKIG